MRELNENTVGVYMTLSMVLIFTPCVFIFDDGFNIVNSFGSYEFFLLGCLGVTGVYFNVLRFKALQYEEPGKLAGISYF